MSAGAAVERAAEAEAGADAIGEIFFRREAKRERRSEEEEAEARFNGMSPWAWGGTAVEVRAARFMRLPSRSSEQDRRSRACVRRAATRCAAPFGETRLPGGGVRWLGWMTGGPGCVAGPPVIVGNCFRFGHYSYSFWDRRCRRM